MNIFSYDITHNFYIFVRSYNPCISIRTAMRLFSLSNQKDDFDMDDIISLCKRRGFVFPSSELYNGYSGFYDYGPLGVELKRNIKNHWWNSFVTKREDVVGLDSSIIQNPLVWKFSGHIDGFSDRMVDCKKTNMRYRADQLFVAPIFDDDPNFGWVCVHEGNDQDMNEEALTQIKNKFRTVQNSDTIQKIFPTSFSFRPITKISTDELSRIPAPCCGNKTLTEPRDFNLMFQTYVGVISDDASLSYLRPETAQGIFLNYKQILETSRLKIPFGIAQIGKVFRNEITPRYFIFRSREFEQMEIEYFVPPMEKIYKKQYTRWIQQSQDFLLSIGISKERLEIKVHSKEMLAHYAHACTDITFQFPFGKQELMGVSFRGNYDLSRHSQGSGKCLDYLDDLTKKRYIPHVIEPSLGVDRLMLALMCSAYKIDNVGGKGRKFLKLHPSIAPIKVAVFPLVKNKPKLVFVARELYYKLQLRWNVAWDATGSIGRRYRRADEVGIPFCITVDFETLEKDEMVTLRKRDTTLQARSNIKDVISFLKINIDGF